MPTPFDDVIDDIKRRRYHNQRLEEHSDIVSRGIFNDLLKHCEPLRRAYESRKISFWLNVRSPGARQRRIDLLVGEPSDGEAPDLSRLRLCIENKSVVTAHRNKDARYDDLNESLQVLHKEAPEAILVATVMIGTAQRVMNVPDRIKPLYKERMNEFEKDVVPRLSSGDQTLWSEFKAAISKNRGSDPLGTLAKFRTLPVRPPEGTDQVGYDFLLLVPVHIDNVNPPSLPRLSSLGIDVNEEYAAMLNHICSTYRIRWPSE